MVRKLTEKEVDRAIARIQAHYSAAAVIRINIENGPDEGDIIPPDNINADEFWAELARIADRLEAKADSW